MSVRRAVIGWTDVAALSCGHEWQVDAPSLRRRKNGWYAAVYCVSCDRKRSVVSMHSSFEEGKP